MKTLPPVALGTWSWGTGFAGGDTVFGNHLSDTQMAEVFTTAMSKGLNLWDTAAVYGMGSSETALGALVRQFPRENMILSTKFTPQIADEQSAQPVSDMLEASLGPWEWNRLISTGSIIPSMSRNGRQDSSLSCKAER